MNSISSSASVCFGVGIVYREGFWEQGVFRSFSAWFIFLGPAWRDSVVRSCVFFSLAPGCFYAYDMGAWWCSGVFFSLPYFCGVDFFFFTVL